mmetsp:Transcript_4314/g.12762  ORF Transcript_4314/g.12762 Transcript_4314/m.12762 type:complete len:186 (+) Transcript_4314:462-1019(+)
MRALALAAPLGTFVALSRRAAALKAPMATMTPPKLTLLGPMGEMLLPHSDFMDSRVGLYFAAGWCPMCTGFEPSLLAFIEASRSLEANAPPVHLIYVSSDMGGEEAAKARAEALGMSHCSMAQATEWKKKFKIWAGREVGELGSGRRGGVPAIVAVDTELNELQYLNAESEGVKCLAKWKEGGAW